MSPAHANPAKDPPSDVDLRAEHEVLMKRLEARRSIDLAKRGAIQGFAAFLALGFVAVLAWDRWGHRWALDHGFTRTPILKPPGAGLPFFFLLALAVFAALLAATVRTLLRSRAIMREEDRDFARLEALRSRLGLDR